MRFSRVTTWSSTNCKSGEKPYPFPFTADNESALIETKKELVGC